MGIRVYTEEQKARAKFLRNTPEAKARVAARNSSPEAKAAKKAYADRPDVKSRIAERRRTPEAKAKQKARRSTPEAKAYSRAYRKAHRQARQEFLNRPEVRETTSAAVKRYYSTPKGIYMKCREGAMKRGLAFEVTLEEVEHLITQSQMRCALSGIPLTLERGNKHKVSIDRVDSSVGYVLANIQIVSAFVNMMKRDSNEGEFIDIARRIWEQNNNG